jgi:stage III sporulation protein SpoIIIAA
MEARGVGWARLIGPEVSREELDELVLEMTGYSIYACEERIGRGSSRCRRGTGGG